MADTKTLLAGRLQRAFDAVEPGADPMLRHSDRADYQANGVLALAKRLGRDPRELAEDIVARAELADVCAAVEVSGPGFLNLTLDDSFVARQLAEVAGDGRLGIEPTEHREKVVVDYSAPNVAKEMHVGHLRTTVIGDALCRLLTFVGHAVVRENHVGDWGTPFGMLIEHLADLGGETGLRELSVGDLDTFYKEARQSFDADESFAERSRRRVVLLQSGDEETMRLWHVLVAESVAHFDEVYRRLGVLLTADDVVGESFYNAQFPEVVAELDSLGLLVENEGALCVFPPGFTNRSGDPLPLIVRKSDGGYGYAASDLATIRDRVGRLGTDLILYVVGAPQAQHFQMCFAVARLAGWLPEGAEAVHVAFGSILGPDKKLLRSRSGESERLIDLLDEAVRRADAAIAERWPTVPAGQRAATASAIGIGAVKYADLSTERMRDYVFDWDRMLASEGNTGPYLQYAHARICSIFRRGEVAPPPPEPPQLAEPAERALALRLLGLHEAVEATLEAWSPSKLCAYLFDVATDFTTFYERCPVLKAPDEATRRSRLFLSDVTARVLALGLSLLGIEGPEHM